MSKDNRGDGKKKGRKKKSALEVILALDRISIANKYCQVPSQLNIKKLKMKIDLPHFLLFDI